MEGEAPGGAWREWLVRVVSIGCPLPSPMVDNHSIANAPSLFDYDACVYDPYAVSEQIEGLAAGGSGMRSADGRPVQAGASGAFSFGLGELLEQRRSELQQLVERGGVLLVFAHPNIAHPSVAAMPGLERYTLIPSPGAGALRRPTLRAADGGEIRVVAPQHPLAEYLDEMSGRLRYRAVWEERSPDFPKDARVLARSVGGAALAVEFALEAGRLVMAPPPQGSLSTADRKRFTAAVLELLARLVDGEGGGREPTWVSRYDTEAIAEAREALSAASVELQEAQRRESETRAALAEAARLSELLWRPNGAKFQALAADAFRLLGYEVVEGASGIELKDEEGAALLELAASEQAVNERVYLTLQSRIEEHFLRRQERPKGIVVVSGQRELDPKMRRQAWTRPLENACETFGYALIPVAALHDLVNFAIEDPDAEGLAELRASIRETAGVLEVEEPEDGPEAASVSENGRAAMPLADEAAAASESG